MRGGFLTADTEWCRDMLKLNVLQANYTAHNVVTRHKYDVLDMHFHFRYQLHRSVILFSLYYAMFIVLCHKSFGKRLLNLNFPSCSCEFWLLVDSVQGVFLCYTSVIVE